MIVNVEFLGEEPLDNVITCLDYQVDRVLYFGYGEQITRQQNTLTNFLKKDCRVQDVQFYELPEEDLDAVIAIMRREIETQVSEENELYFDITGGESLALIAFGVLSRDYDTPMHGYDIANHKFHEYECGSVRKISERVPRQNVKLNIKQHIRLRGGVVNERLHKDVKDVRTPEFNHQVSQIWHVAKKHLTYWNPFSDFLKNNMAPDEDLIVARKTATIKEALEKSKSKLNNMTKFDEIVDDLERAGALVVLLRNDENYRIQFQSPEIKACLWEGGSILELHTYQMFRCRSEDCGIGVHLDWDGVIHPQTTYEDVDNEVDVISLDEHVLTFISCKSGGVSKKDLYELETVTRRFGGKYARMIFVIMQPMNAVDRLRAQEMGIEVLEV